MSIKKQLSLQVQKGDTYQSPLLDVMDMAPFDIICTSNKIDDYNEEDYIWQ